MDQQDLPERRKLKRRSLAYYMLVLDARTQEKIGHLVDITPIGLMMDSKKPFPLDKEFQLRLDITSDVGSKDHINFTARSKWCAPDVIEPDLFDIGFSIVSIAPSDVVILRFISEKYAAREAFTFPPE